MAALAPTTTTTNKQNKIESWQACCVSVCCIRPCFLEVEKDHWQPQPIYLLKRNRKRLFLTKRVEIWIVTRNLYIILPPTYIGRGEDNKIDKDRKIIIDDSLRQTKIVILLFLMVLVFYMIQSYIGIPLKTGRPQAASGSSGVSRSPFASVVTRREQVP